MNKKIRIFLTAFTVLQNFYTFFVSAAISKNCLEALWQKPLHKTVGLVLIDPLGFRAGENLPLLAKEKNIPTVVVISGKSLPQALIKGLQLVPKDIPIITHQGNSVETNLKIREELAKLGAVPSAVLPGTESGVILADELSQLIPTPNNGTDLSLARRDKFEMHEALKRAGIKSVKQLKTNSYDETMKWLENNIPNWTQKKVVLKPLQSGGTDRVFVCANESEVRRAFSAIIGSKDTFGKVDSELVVQEFLSGDEYIFDTVSTTLNKKTIHMPVAAWKYYRKSPIYAGRAEIIDHVDFVPFENLPKGMNEYSKKVLDAVGIQYGAAHIEIIQTEEGPVMVEVGARLPGGIPRLATKATGNELDQAKMMVDSYLRPEHIFELYSEHKGQYPTKDFAEVVFLSVDFPNAVASETKITEINQNRFPTFEDIKVLSKTEVPLSVTSNVFDALLRVHFVGKPEDVKRDVELIKKMHEQNYFYE